jgi:hypothetical protein
MFGNSRMERPIYGASHIASLFSSRQYAVVLDWFTSIYNQYQWRFHRQIQLRTKRWNGLEDDDVWQKGYLKSESAALREINFWVGN